MNAWLSLWFHRRRLYVYVRHNHLSVWQYEKGRFAHQGSAQESTDVLAQCLEKNPKIPVFLILEAEDDVWDVCVQPTSWYQTFLALWPWQGAGPRDASLATKTFGVTSTFHLPDASFVWACHRLILAKGCLCFVHSFSALCVGFYRSVFKDQQQSRPLQKAQPHKVSLFLAHVRAFSWVGLFWDHGRMIYARRVARTVEDNSRNLHTTLQETALYGAKIQHHYRPYKKVLWHEEGALPDGLQGMGAWVSQGYEDDFFIRVIQRRVPFWGSRLRLTPRASWMGALFKRLWASPVRLAWHLWFFLAALVGGGLGYTYWQEPRLRHQEAVGIASYQELTKKRAVFPLSLARCMQWMAEHQQHPLRGLKKIAPLVGKHFRLRHVFWQAEKPSGQSLVLEMCPRATSPQRAVKDFRVLVDHLKAPPYAVKVEVISDGVVSQSDAFYAGGFADNHDREITFVVKIVW
ncbi:hypothetical protein [Candidatus Hepatobacter penaei]|uniref:hypothetical protein n=1 Tax=Candidatus Hepatobacter penaei TaxID=1274402 RepID=UPI0012DFEDA7|nr:hypothetical protein [Candidatus Hepatobacter penaei]